VLEPKMKVDGITKYIDTTDFKFDNTFGDREETNILYDNMVSPVIESLFNKGVVTVFAYG
jgi:kinesin family protein 2/24